MFVEARAARDVVFEFCDTNRLFFVPVTRSLPGPPLKRGKKTQKFGFYQPGLKKGTTVTGSKPPSISPAISGGFTPFLMQGKLGGPKKGNVNPGLINPYSDY